MSGKSIPPMSIYFFQVPASKIQTYMVPTLLFMNRPALEVSKITKVNPFV